MDKKIDEKWKKSAKDEEKVNPEGEKVSGPIEADFTTFILLALFAVPLAIGVMIISKPFFLNASAIS